MCATSGVQPVGMIELVAVLAIALLVFGPKKLPEVGRTLGKSIKDFKNGISEMDEIKDSFKVDLNPKIDLDAKGKSKSSSAAVSKDPTRPA